MAGKNFKNMAALYKYLEVKIADALQNEVGNEVVKVMAEDGGSMDKYVYGVYTPYSKDGVTKHYERTFQLKHPSNFQVKMLDKKTVAIRSTREEDGRKIYKIIETGEGYDWGYARNLNEEIGARPVHAQTAKDLNQDKSRLVRAMKTGLARGGIRTV